MLPLLYLHSSYRVRRLLLQTCSKLVSSAMSRGVFHGVIVCVGLLPRDLIVLSAVYKHNKKRDPASKSLQSKSLILMCNKLLWTVIPSQTLVVINGTLCR